MWIEGNWDGTSVLTAVSEGDTYVAEVVLEDSGSSKSTILFVHWEAGMVERPKRRENDENGEDIFKEYSDP